MKNNLIKILIVLIALSLIPSVAAKANTHHFEDERDKRLKGITEVYKGDLKKSLANKISPKNKSSHMLVLLSADLDLDLMLNKINFDYLNFIKKDKGYLFEVGLNDFNKIKTYFLDYLVSFEPLRLRSSLNLPNDPYASEQWGHFQTNYYQVWQDISSSSEVLSCVIDSGISRRHPDLLGSDIRVGYNYYTEDEVGSDFGGHGTHVSAIISATTNNNIGIVGLSKSAIVPFQVKYDSEDIYTSDIISAIYDAADTGCDVINLSLGSNSYSSAESAAIDYAIESGSLVVAAAGNDGSSLYTYPASYDSVISVGSINSRLLKSDFSNYNDKVTLVAPGEGIITANNRWGYVTVDGTSFSAPYVSAAGAIVKSFDKTVSQAEFKKILEKTSFDLGPRGYDNYYGHGLLNIESIVDIYKNLPPDLIKDATEILAQSQGYSKLGFSEKLVSMGYSLSQVSLAIEKLSPSWQDQAVKSAKYTLNDKWTYFSTEDLSQELLWQGYLESEVLYALQSIGYQADKVDFLAKSKKLDHLLSLNEVIDVDFKILANNKLYSSDASIIRMKTFREKLNKDTTTLVSKSITGKNPGKITLSVASNSGQLVSQKNIKVLGLNEPVIKHRFSDVSKSHEFFDYITYLAINEITTGYTQGSKAGRFGINESLSRRHAAMFLFRDLNLKKPSRFEGIFNDIKASDSGAYEIEALAKLNIISGQENKDGSRSFKPNNNLTRAQFSKMIAEAYGLKPDASKEMTLKDVQDKNWWGYNYVKALVDSEIVSGYASNNTFRPNNKVTRGQVSKFFYMAEMDKRSK